MKTDYNGLVRPQLETFLFEEVGIDHVNESHRVLYELMMTKLKSKVDHPGVINKAIVNEQKVIYKYKDIQDVVVRRIAAETILKRMDNTEVMKKICEIAIKAKEPKANSKKKKTSLVAKKKK